MARDADRGRALDAALLEQILEAAPAAFAFFDTDLCCRFANPRLAELTGLGSAEAHLDKDVSEVFARWTAEERHALRRVLKTRAPEPAFEIDPCRADGPRWSVICHPVRSGGDGVGRVLGIGVLAWPCAASAERDACRAEVAMLTQQVRDAALQRRALLHDVMDSVTDGRLRLCDSAADLPERWPEIRAAEPLSPASLHGLRAAAGRAAEACGIQGERQFDLESAVGEAATNALRHAGGGTATIRGDGATGVQVWIVDSGTGISDDVLHKAVLERGWGAADSFGHGYFMILRAIDRLYLLTGPTGTTLVLEQFRVPPQPDWTNGIGFS